MTRLELIEEHINYIKKLCYEQITEDYSISKEKEIEELLSEINTVYKYYIMPYEEELTRLREYFEKIKRIYKSKYALQISFLDEKIKVYDKLITTLLISSYLLFKEKTIQKDCSLSNQTIFFDYNDNIRLIPYMKEFYNSIINLDFNTGENIIGGSNLRIKLLNTPEEEKEELKKIVWVMNKIRDSFVHNCYKEKEDRFVINNDNMNQSNNKYLFRGEITFDSLYNIVEKMIGNEEFTPNELFEPSYTLMKLGNKDVMIITEEQKKLLAQSRNKNTEQINSIRDLTDYFDWPSLKASELKKSFTQVFDIEKIEERKKEQATDLINSIASYWNEEPSKEILQATYLYNYMSQVFSQIETTNLDLSTISIDNIDINLLVVNNNINEILNKINNDMTKFLSSINRITKNDSKSLQFILDLDINTLHEGELNAIRGRINRFYEQMNIDYNNLVENYVRLIRNGVQHGNYEYHDGIIKIVDKEDQRTSVEKAIFKAPIERWYEFSNDVLSRDKSVYPISEEITCDMDKFRNIVSFELLNKINVYLDKFKTEEQINILQK